MIVEAGDGRDMPGGMATVYSEQNRIVNNGTRRLGLSLSPPRCLREVARTGLQGRRPDVGSGNHAHC